MISTTLAIILAILSPCIFAFMNTLDKFIVLKKIKSTVGFTALAGIATLFFGIVLSLFLDWNEVGIIEIWPAAVSGIIFGAQYFLYYKVMSRGDASNFSGLTYVYPLLVALFSFIFLKENLSLIGYIGVGLSITGSLLLSFRIKKLNGMIVVYLIGLNIILIALYEFLIKISTTNLSEWNGISLEFIFIGVTICGFFLFSKKMRKLAFQEKHNLRWAFFAEFFTLLAITATFFAMGKLSATIVSTIATIQPIMVLFLERATTKIFGKIYKDKITLTRIISMGLIIVGVILLISAN